MVLPLIPIAGWTAAALGTAAAGTAAASPTLLREFPGLKQDLDWTAEDAAREEIRQGDGKGYDVKTGQVNRGIIEGLRDRFVGNSNEAITKAAQDLHVDTLKLNNKGVADLNSRLTALNQSTIKFTPTTSQAEIDEKVAKIKRTLPQLEAYAAANNGNLDGMSIDTDQGTLAGAVDDARHNKGQHRYRNSQEYLDMKNQQNLTNQIALGQMSLSEQRLDNQMQMAMMNNQLEMRRQDSADRRMDRRDRQAMIQQMMAGLSTLGASIAI